MAEHRATRERAAIFDESSFAKIGRDIAIFLASNVVAAIVALVLGAGTLLANAYVVIRRRAYELAALRAGFG